MSVLPLALKIVVKVGSSAKIGKTNIAVWPGVLRFTTAKKLVRLRRVI